MSSFVTGRESDAERARFLRDPFLRDLSPLVAAHVADIHDHVGEELDDDAALVVGPNTVLSGDGQEICHARESYCRRDEPDTVSTRAEFDALPAGTVVRRDATDEDGDYPVVAERADFNDARTGEGLWWITSARDSVGSGSLVLDGVPYTVLYRPGGAS